MDSVEQIGFVLKQLFAAYPGNKATEGTVAVYVRFLQDIPTNELQAVVDQCIVESEFLPTIAKIKEMHRQMHSAVSPDLAAQGWLSVQKALRDPATYSPTPEGPMPKFRDPLVAKAVEALGWHNLRLSENAMADRAQFLKFYGMFANSEAGEQRLSPEFKQLREVAQEREGFGGLRQIGTVLNGVHGGEN